jgi:hypothetical protein
MLNDEKIEDFSIFSSGLTLTKSKIFVSPKGKLRECAIWVLWTIFRLLFQISFLSQTVINKLFTATPKFCDATLAQVKLLWETE